MNVNALWRKVVRRANRYYHILLGFIPANRKLKPIGVKPLLTPHSHRSDDDSIEYLELNPPYVSTLNLSKQFTSDCSDFAKPEMTVQIPGDFIVTLKNGRVYSYDPSNTAIITMNNYVVDELSFQWEARGEVLVGGSENK